MVIERRNFLIKLVHSMKKGHSVPYFPSVIHLEERKEGKGAVDEHKLGMFSQINC